MLNRRTSLVPLHAAPGAVIGIIDVVDAVADIFGANLNPPRFVPIQFVNVDTLRRMLAEAPVVCARYGLYIEQLLRTASQWGGLTHRVA